MVRLVYAELDETDQIKEHETLRDVLIVIIALSISIVRYAFYGLMVTYLVRETV